MAAGILPALMNPGKNIAVPLRDCAATRNNDSATMTLVISLCDLRD